MAKNKKKLTIPNDHEDVENEKLSLLLMGVQNGTV